MAFKYVHNINKDIHYIALSTDTKLNGDIGSILFTYDDGKYYINVDGATSWQAFVAPKLAT